MSDFLRPLKDLRFKIFYRALSGRRRPLVKLGSPECNWVICPEGLGWDSVVYGGGVGRDISFEHELVRRFGCRIVLFDPSPTGLATMAKPENQIQAFRFFPVALAGSCGTLKLSRPKFEDEGSWFKKEGGDADMEVPATDLLSLMRKNGHNHIDLLKLDIEGAEYDVIDHIVKNKLSVRQIIVEFHNNLLPGFTRGQTVKAMLKLRLAGYKLAIKDGENHSFLK